MSPLVGVDLIEPPVATGPAGIKTASRYRAYYHDGTSRELRHNDPDRDAWLEVRNWLRDPTNVPRVDHSAIAAETARRTLLRRFPLDIDAAERENRMRDLGRPGAQGQRDIESVVGGRSVVVAGRCYRLEPSDALTLFGALAMAVDGETASITLASGDTLELTHEEVSDLGRQLAGKPADEVSGSDRSAGEAGS